mmetsp:Transcript_13176/g.53187  ORF Transcript_13176/g.53187 Transcript_13176/m.53187 type:complete len:342 (+) Transcript_13176:1502-2527(+)
MATRHHPDVPSRRTPAFRPAPARVPVNRLAPDARAALARALLRVRLAVLRAKLAQAPPRLRLVRAPGVADGVDSKASGVYRVPEGSFLRRFRRVVLGRVERRVCELKPERFERLVGGGAVRGGGRPERVPRRRSIAAVAKAFVGAARDPNLVHRDVLVETRLEPRAVARVAAAPHRFAVEPGSAVRQRLVRDVRGGGVSVVAVFAAPPRHLVRDTRGVLHRVHERGVLDARPLGAVALFDGVVKVVRRAGRGRVDALDRFARVRGIVGVVDALIDRAVRAVVLEAEPERHALTVAVRSLPQRRRSGRGAQEHRDERREERKRREASADHVYRPRPTPLGEN